MVVFSSFPPYWNNKYVDICQIFYGFSCYSLLWIQLLTDKKLSWAVSSPACSEEAVFTYDIIWFWKTNRSELGNCYSCLGVFHALEASTRWETRNRILQLTEHFCCFSWRWNIFVQAAMWIMRDLYSRQEYLHAKLLHGSTRLSAAFQACLMPWVWNLRNQLLVTKAFSPFPEKANKKNPNMSLVAGGVIHSEWFGKI